jgi:hypothetical protein
VAALAAGVAALAAGVGAGALVGADACLVDGGGAALGAASDFPKIADFILPKKLMLSSPERR